MKRLQIKNLTEGPIMLPWRRTNAALAGGSTLTLSAEETSRALGHPESKKELANLVHNLKLSLSYLDGTFITKPPPVMCAGKATPVTEEDLKVEVTTEPSTNAETKQSEEARAEQTSTETATEENKETDSVETAPYTTKARGRKQAKSSNKD